MFLWDQRQGSIDEAMREFYSTLHSEEDDPKVTDPDAFTEQLVRGASMNVSDLDARITSKSANWRLERMPAVDRNILRLAVYEMSSTDTPAPVVIDEALELAREFSTDESVAFINGVLDALHRDSP